MNTRVEPQENDCLSSPRVPFGEDEWLIWDGKTDPVTGVEMRLTDGCWWDFEAQRGVWLTAAQFHLRLATAADFKAAIACHETAAESLKEVLQDIEDRAAGMPPDWRWWAYLWDDYVCWLDNNGRDLWLQRSRYEPFIVATTEDFFAAIRSGNAVPVGTPKDLEGD